MKMNNRKRVFFLTFVALLFLASCHSKKSEIHPQLSYSVQDKYLQSLHPIFDPLTPEEKETKWGQEYYLGLSFAKHLDLYRAVTCFKRADFLIGNDLHERKAEIEYQIVNAYYFGKRYAEAIESFEESSLASTNRTFIAFRDLLIILFDSYLQEKEWEKANWMVRALEKYFPLDAKKLSISAAIQKADLEELNRLSNAGTDEIRLAELTKRAKGTSEIFLEDEEEEFITANVSHVISNSSESGLTFQEEIELEELKSHIECKQAANAIIHEFAKKQKSPALAMTLNAALPGLGYLYLGQVQTAFTALWLNGLFIGATTYFFKEGNIPAALISLGFESGWYFGGIVGAKENAIFYNERMFENEAHVRMRDHKLYPILMLSHGF